jgi:small subunit ribosomal protein S4
MDKEEKKPTDYGIQLMAKQKLKGYYGNIGEKQFKKYYTEAVRKKGDTGANLIGILECRLDAVLYRMKLAPTVFSCRQLINNCHVLVNGIRCNIPSRMVNVGDTVSLKEKAKGIPAVIEATTLPERDVPDYVEVDHTKFSGSLIRIPMPDEVPYPVQMETNLVIEFYSR